MSIPESALVNKSIPVICNSEEEDNLRTSVF